MELWGGWWTIIVFWNSLIILPNCSMNPETAVTMQLWSFQPSIFCSEDTSGLSPQCPAMTAGQPPDLTILCMYCTGGTECLSRTPGSHSVCAVRTPLGINWKIISIRKEPMKLWGGRPLEVQARDVLGSTPGGCQPFSLYFCLITSKFISSLRQGALSIYQNVCQRMIIINLLPKATLFTQLKLTKLICKWVNLGKGNNLENIKFNGIWPKLSLYFNKYVILSFS